MMKKQTLDPRSLFLYGWTVLFFALFSSIGSLEQRSMGLFFLTLVKNALLWGLVLAAGAIAFAYLKQKGWFEQKPMRMETKYFALIVFGLLLLCALPYYLALFPGTFGADAPVQLGQYDGTVILSTHHPLLHTYLIGWLVDLGTLITGSGNGGVAFYTVFQIVLCDAAICSSLVYLKEKGLPAWILIACLLFVGLNPFVQVLLCYSTKDVPFAAALLLFVIGVCRYLSKPKAASLACLTFWGIILCLLRNQGIYMILIGAAIAWVCGSKLRRKKKMKIWLVSQILIALIAYACNSVLPSMLSIGAGSVREMLSVPSHQIANAISLTETGQKQILSQDQLNAARAFYIDFQPDMYDPLSADPDKNQLDGGLVSKNMMSFVSIWVQSVFADFEQAVYAWTDLIAPYFDMTRSTYFTGMNMLFSYPQHLQSRGIESHSLLPQFQEVQQNLMTSDHQKQLGWKIALFSPSASLYLLIWLTGYAIVRKNRSCLMASLYGLLYFGSILLGPVALSRYIFPLMLQMPLWLGMLYAAGRKRALISASENE